MKKVGMIGVISNPVKSLSSHNGGWTYVCKSIIEEKLNCKLDILTEKDDWDAYDTLIINEGINFKSGTYNFFGGVSDKTIAKLVKYSNYKGEVYSINESVDYNDMCKKRKELNDFKDELRVPSIIELSNTSKKLVLGDSHSVSVYRPGYSISRNDGKTLHGFLKNGIESHIESLTEELIFYAGNIDIRFHVSRLGIESTDEMILELESQLNQLNLEKITLVELLPIENESRKIPGTGKYKGASFNGSREVRQEMVLHFNSMLRMIARNNNWEVLKWDYNYEEELPFEDMEARQSVHLRPSSYMYANEFINVETNTLF